MKIFKVLFIALGLMIINGRAAADEIFRIYNPGRTDLSLGIDYFKSNSNFISDGTKTDLFSGNYFQSINTIITARYVLWEDFGLTAQAQINSSESSDVISTRRNSSLSLLTLGADYQILNTTFWNLVADLSYSYAAEKINPTSDSVMNSDGADEVKGFLTTALNFNPFIPFFKIGINYRTQGLSTLLLYSGGAELRFDNIVLGGLISGSSTMKEDENTAKPYIRDTLTGRVNAGSKRYDGVNSTLLDSEIYLKYNIDNDFFMKAFGGYTVLGSNSAVGFHLGASVTWSFGGETISKKSRSSKGKQLKKTKPNENLTVDPNDKSFSEDTNDGVNQDYFKTISPGKDEYIEQLEGPPKSLKNATELEPSNQKGAFGTPETLEKEYKIKLKKKKKKKKKKTSN